MGHHKDFYYNYIMNYVTNSKTLVTTLFKKCVLSTILPTQYKSKQGLLDYTMNRFILKVIVFRIPHILLKNHALIGVPSFILQNP